MPGFETTAAAQGVEQSGEAPPRAAWPSPAQSQDAQPKAAPAPAWGARPATGPAAEAAPPARGGWWQSMLAMQQQFFRQMGDALKSFKSESFFSASWALITVSFLYGVFHAAGPGHGKAVISSYVLANGATVRRGVSLSFLAALVQALSAIGIVSVLAVALNAAGLEIRQIAQRFEVASGLLITLAGLWLLTAYVWRRFLVSAPAPILAHAHAGHPHHHDHGHDHHHHHHHHHDENCGCGHAHMPDPRDLEKDFSIAKAAAIVLAVGIRPCSGAIFILVFALTQGLYWAGIGATFAMALGTAITVSALAIAAVMFRSATLQYAGSRWTTGLYDVAAIAGSCLVIFFGVGLFLSSLGPVRPF
ncbi:MAG: nickel/cobalt transporter [Rhodomicrobiaceae bacterium]